MLSKSMYRFLIEVTDSLHNAGDLSEALELDYEKNA